ncbi:MAG: hypothetical protein E7Z90_02745 [Cyanobacteria bacterium SIG29]|nr:hypothetical protein [Cyanobacteria bacterium SIG29]
MNTVLLPINEYLNKLEEADNNQKNVIENELVNIGKEAVPSLVDSLQVVKGKTRGIVAMVLIRIGESSIDYLRRAAESNSDFEWIANYLITEIKGQVA